LSKLPTIIKFTGLLISSEQGDVKMALAERRQREKDQRREDIVNAAEKLFFSRGYDNVSMDEIAGEVELSKPALYYYFKDKESLFFAVVNRGVKILRAMVEEEVKSAQANGIKIGAIATAFEKFIQKYPDYARAYFHFWSGRFDISNDKNVSPDAKEIIEFTWESYEKSLLILKKGIEEGVIRSDVSPVVVVVLNNLIATGIMNMSPYLRRFMEVHGITMEQFYLEVANLVSHMAMDNGEGNESIRERMLKWRSNRFASEQNKN
jgi:AcrR family transcriptional regulator